MASDARRQIAVARPTTDEQIHVDGESIFALCWIQPFGPWAVMDDGAKTHPETSNEGLVIKIGLSSRHISACIWLQWCRKCLAAHRRRRLAGHLCIAIDKVRRQWLGCPVLKITALYLSTVVFWSSEKSATNFWIRHPTFFVVVLIHRRVSLLLVLVLRNVGSDQSSTRSIKLSR